MGINKRLLKLKILLIKICKIVTGSGANSW